MLGGERSERYVWIPGARTADSWAEVSLPSRAWSGSNSTWDKSRVTATVDLDEITAALVLSSLSCSPRVNLSHPTPEPGLGDSRKRSGSVITSDCWSGDSSSPSPPPLSKPVTIAPRGDGVNLRDPRPSSPEESEPGKCRVWTAGRTQSGNSVKPSYRCMWPCCSKCLSSTVGIRRHIRTIHLSSGDSEHSNGDEDFYYTEIQPGPERCSENPGLPHCALLPPAPRFTEAVGPQQLGVADVDPDVAAPTAPSCLRQVSVDHTYQVSLESSCNFTLMNLSSPPQVALLKPHIVFAPTPTILHGGRCAVKRRNAGKCTVWRTAASGARPVGGRRLASASMTDHLPRIALFSPVGQLGVSLMLGCLQKGRGVVATSGSSGMDICNRWEISRATCLALHFMFSCPRHLMFQIHAASCLWCGW